MTDFLFRPVNPTVDAQDLADIYRPYVLEAWVSFEVEPPSAAVMAERAQGLLDRNLPFTVAEDKSGKVVGYAYAGPYRARPAYSKSVENSIYLDASVQGKGLAKGLMLDLIKTCQDRQFKTMIAVVGLDPDLPLEHSQSFRFHKKMGFKHIGVLENIGRKFDRWTGTAVLQLDLGENEADRA